MKKRPRTEATERLPSPLDLLPPEPLLQQYEKALGALTMRISLFHFILEMELWSLLGIDENSGRVLTEDLPLSNLMHRFERAVKTKNPQPTYLKMLRKTLKDLREVNDKRNRFVHALWQFPPGGHPFLVPKKGRVIREDAPPVTELEELEHRAELLMLDFIRLNHQMFSNPAS